MVAKSGALAFLSQVCFVSCALVFSAPDVVTKHDGSCLKRDEGKAADLPTGTNPHYSIEVEVKIPSDFNKGIIVAWGHGVVGAGPGGIIEAMLLPTRRIIQSWNANDLETTTPNIWDDQWHQLAFTYDGTDRCIHVDFVTAICDKPNTIGGRFCSDPANNECGTLEVDSKDRFCVGGLEDSNGAIHGPWPADKGSFRNLKIYSEGRTVDQMKVTTTETSTTTTQTETTTTETTTLPMIMIDGTVGGGPTLVAHAILGAILFLVLN